jgi:hypothetical protein
MQSKPENITVTTTDSLGLQYDSESTLHLREFAEGLGERYAGDEFQYAVDAPENTNFLFRIIGWVLDMISSFLRWLFDGLGIELTPELMQLMEILVYLIFGGVVLYFIIRFFSKESARSLFRKKSHVLPTVDLSQTHIETLDLNHLLDKALQAKNYRMAIRYHYLLVLQQLSQKQFIDWQFDKTNADYIRELAQTQFKAPFGEVSYLYNHIWYGEQPIDAPIFERAVQPFQRLKQDLDG